MIYFDNAATTMLKPPQVAEAVARAINSFGGVGRGAHDAALDADMAVFRCRQQLAALFNAPSAKRVCFALNVTEALNACICGLLGPGGHAVTTAASHNSVLRPLQRMADERGVDVTVLPVATDASMDYDAFDTAFGPATKLAVVTHASNVTGDIYDVARMAAIAHEHGALICVDAAQTAGAAPIDMQQDGLDIVCFTGHKSLYGPQGTGGMALAEHVELPAFKEGGSGTHSYDARQPGFFPEHMEAGTQNAHGIAGLSAGLAYIEEHGVQALGAQAQALAQRFEEGVARCANVRVYGGHAAAGRTGIVALNIGDTSSAEVSDLLSREYGICTRPGAHCAPRMHECLGTAEQGVVRFSFSSLNTASEVDEAIAAVAEIAGALL